MMSYIFDLSMGWPSIAILPRLQCRSCSDIDSRAELVAQEECIFFSQRTMVISWGYLMGICGIIMSIYIYIVYIYIHGISWYHGDIEWFGMRRSYNMKYEWYMNGILVK